MARAFELFLKPDAGLDRAADRLAAVLGLAWTAAERGGERVYEWRGDGVELLLGGHELEDDRDMPFSRYPLQLSVRPVKEGPAEEWEARLKAAATRIYDALERRTPWSLMLTDDLQKNLAERSVAGKPKDEAAGGASHRAVFAGTRPAQETFRLARERLAQADWEPVGKLAPLRYAFDETRGLYTASSALSETPFEARLPAYGHWAGAGQAFKRGRAVLTAEALQPDPPRGRPGLLVLGVQEAEAKRHAKSAEEATRWAGLLVDLFEAVGAVRCVYGPGLPDLDLGTRKELPAGATLALLGKDDPLAKGLRAAPPGGMKVTGLTMAALLLTSLPVKPAP